MKIVIRIAAIKLPDGKFHPDFSLVEDIGSSVTNIGYDIDMVDSYETKEEALKNAQIIAVQEAKKQYGEDIEISIHVDNLT